MQFIEVWTLRPPTHVVFCVSMYLCVYMLFSKMHYKPYLNSAELGIMDGLWNTWVGMTTFGEITFFRCNTHFYVVSVPWTSLDISLHTHPHTQPHTHTLTYARVHTYTRTHTHTHTRRKSDLKNTETSYLTRFHSYSWKLNQTSNKQFVCSVLNKEFPIHTTLRRLSRMSFISEWMKWKEEESKLGLCVIF